MQNIVVAVDFSDATPVVMHVAGEMARAHHARLHLIHTVDPGPNYAIYGFGPTEFPPGTLTEKAVAASDEKLAALAGDCGLPQDRVSATTVVALPVDGILDFAKDQHADMLVVGAHGHGFFGSVIVGSVAQGVVRRAQLPTLVVPASAGSKA